MNSPLLALFMQSLSQETYGKAAYWARAGLCGFVFFLIFALVQANAWASATGLMFFGSLIVLQMVAITVIGMSYFGSAIAEEKEEQTLGLLRMTDLNSFSILLGKSTSRLCGALLLLTAVFPFTIFAVTLGGVSLAQVLAAYCTLAAYLFLLANVALLGSVLARHTAGAATFTGVVMGGLLAAGPILKELESGLQKLRVPLGLDTVGEVIWHHTPIARLQAILGIRFSGAPIDSQAISNVILGILFFLLSWAAFGRFCDRAPNEPGEPRRGILRAVHRPIRRRSRPSRHAIEWKDFHFLYGGKRGAILRVLLYLLIPITVLGVLRLGPSETFNANASVFNTWIPLIFCLDAGAMAARMFRSEFNDQTYSTLAILPGTIRRLAYRKAHILFLAMAPGLFAALALKFLFLWINPYRYYGTSQTLPLMRIIINSAEFLLWTAVFLHVVVWLSLLLKRGALPVGIAATGALSLLVSLLSLYMMTKYRDIFLWMRSLDFPLETTFNLFFLATVSLTLHVISLRRLEAIAFER